VKYMPAVPHAIDNANYVHCAPSLASAIHTIIDMPLPQQPGHGIVVPRPSSTRH
jgi:hypothetical protein